MSCSLSRNTMGRQRENWCRLWSDQVRWLDDLFKTNHFHFLRAILFITSLSQKIFSKLIIFTFSEQSWLPVGFSSSTATSSLVCTPRLETFLIGRRTGGRWKTAPPSSSSSLFFHEYDRWLTQAEKKRLINEWEKEMLQKVQKIHKAHTFHFHNYFHTPMNPHKHGFLSGV